MAFRYHLLHAWFGVISKKRILNDPRPIRAPAGNFLNYLQKQVVELMQLQN